MVLLIYPRHSPFPHSISTPLSIFCLGSYLEEKGEEVEYFDERIQDFDYLFSLLKKRPALAGISTMTSYQIKRAVNIASLIRRYFPAILLAWGGVHPTMCPAQTLESELADFVIKGEGEETLWELVRQIKSGQNKDFSLIQGLAWKKNGQIIENDNRQFLDINSLPFPYSGKAGVLLNTYLNTKTSRESIAIQTSRGCSFHCSFCYNNFFSKSTSRIKSREKLDEELGELKRRGVGEVIFMDDNLGASRRHIYDLCALTEKYGIKWSGGMRIDIIDGDLVKKLETSGCRYLFFGVESIDKNVLDSIHKHINLEQLARAIGLMSKSSIDTVYSFMNGFPQEGRDCLNEQIGFIDKLLEVSPSAEIAIQPYNPLPGTPLFYQALKEGFSPPGKLLDWWKMTTGEVLGPWVKDKALLKNLYLVSFLAFRGDRFLKNMLFFPLSKIARVRWRSKFFKLGFERYLYAFMVKAFVISDDIKSAFRRIRWNLF